MTFFSHDFLYSRDTGFQRKHSLQQDPLPTPRRWPTGKRFMPVGSLTDGASHVSFPGGDSLHRSPLPILARKSLSAVSSAAILQGSKLFRSPITMETKRSRWERPWSSGRRSALKGSLTEGFKRTAPGRRSSCQSSGSFWRGHPLPHRRRKKKSAAATTPLFLAGGR